MMMVVMTVMMILMMMLAKRTNPAISGVVVPRTNQAWISSAHGVVEEDLDDDDDIYNDAVYVCKEKSSLPPGSPPEPPITILYKSGLVLMVPDLFFMVPGRFL